jgi:hypothetical protein
VPVTHRPFGALFLLFFLCAFAACRLSGAALIRTGLCADLWRSPIPHQIRNQKSVLFGKAAAEISVTQL